MNHRFLFFAPLLLSAGLACAQPESVGARGRLVGEDASGLELPVGSMVWPPERRAGLLASPSGPEWFVGVADLQREVKRQGLKEALRPLLWPRGAEPDPRLVRVFVQGLNTPRADGKDIGADSRLSLYLSEGYLEGPVLALYNGTALEATAPLEPDRIELPLRGTELVRHLVPLRRRDFYWALRLRMTHGTSNPQTLAELKNISRLIEATLGDPSGARLHLVGYSDGHLLIEEALRRSLPALKRLFPARELERVLSQRLFIEAWGNASPPLVRGPRRLFVHDRVDAITGGKLPGGETFGVRAASDLPPGFAESTVILTFEGPYPAEDLNNHNALTTIGPALRAIRQAEGVRGTVALYRALRARGGPQHHYALAGFDWRPFERWRWKTGAAAKQPRPRGE